MLDVYSVRLELVVVIIVLFVFVIMDVFLFFAWGHFEHHLILGGLYILELVPCCYCLCSPLDLTRQQLLCFC